MREVFLSIRGRVLVNVEALSMTESVGNYVKHRRVPVILPEEEGYSVYFVPAISGESIAHGFQKVLADISGNINPPIPVCNLCSRGIFLKSTNESVFRESFGVEVPKEDNDLERLILENCIVEDVGGFLYAHGGRNIKRTSNFFTGYMIPVKESLKNIVIEPQLHARYALGTPFVKKGEERGQMIYYVELTSAPYVFGFDLDTKFIGKLTFSYEHCGELVVSVEDRKKRLEATLNAIQKFILEFMFGAKKTRFLPVIEWESAVIAVSDDTWTVPSPFTKRYIENAKSKLGNISYNTKLYVYEEGRGSFEETVINAINDAKNRLGIPEEK